MADSRESDFTAFFRDATGFERPYEWQIRVAVEGLPNVLPIPTGLGKTEGAVLAWAWRKFDARLDEPLHLVYCLPMRSLVSQTVERLETCFDALAAARGTPRIPIYHLMAGAIDEEWANSPEQPWILVGTQDQLLSRALNRGYSMNRFEWSVHFGLLNQDCQWIVDEVQLMGPGLWTTAQLDWMRRKRFPALKSCRTTWMSATVGGDFLATTDRKKAGISTPAPFDPRLDEDDNKELRRRRSARRPVKWFELSTSKRARAIHEQIASSAAQEHRAGTLTLVICNTVEMARRVFESLADRVPRILLTSRFRANDRRSREQQLLDFEARRRKSESGEIEGDPGLICVSTQVIEAGVDVSAHRLWSELAPWPSVIQRLGRLNRDGRDGSADAHFWHMPKEQERTRGGQVWVGPYLKEKLDRAKTLVDALAALSLEVPFAKAIEKLQESHRELVQFVLQPEPAPMPRALDVHGLFSTERDVHGGFTDVSPFVRGSDPDADLTVFWRLWSGKNPPRGESLVGPPFDPAEGCAIPFYRLSESLKAQRAKAWIWNDEGERWEACPHRDLRPGMVIMLHRDVGGYDARRGWTGDVYDVLNEVPAAGSGRALPGEELTETGRWVALDVHLKDARVEAERICDALSLGEPLRMAVVEAATFHDLGKAHPQWQAALPAGRAAHGGPWAKCPRVLGLDVPSADVDVSEVVNSLRAGARAMPAEPRRQGGLRLRWIVDQKLSLQELKQLRAALPIVRWAGHVPFRPKMRHEAASALAMWERYRKRQASYPALAVYLAAAHHGKVRTVLRSILPDGNDVFGVQCQADALVVSGEYWPFDFSVAADGAAGEWRESEFVLTGYGWTGVVADLLGPWRDHNDDPSDAGAVPMDEPRRLGPFALAWLEALVRVADWRASGCPSKSLGSSEVPGGD